MMLHKFTRQTRIASHRGWTASHAVGLFLLLTFIAFVPASHSKAEVGWVLDQRSKVTGAHRVTLTPTKLRVDSIGYDVTVVCSAPSYKVTAYSTRKKLLFKTTAIQYRGMPAAYVFGNIRTDMQKGHWREKGKTTVAGREADVRVMAKSGLARRETSRFEVEHANGVHSAVYKSMAGVKIPDGFALILARLYAIPAYPRLPLEVVYTDPTGSENLSLCTTRCQKKEFSDSVFAVPGGLKTARQEDDLYVSQSQDAALETGINWLGEVGDLSDRKKPKGNGKQK